MASFRAPRPQYITHYNRSTGWIANIVVKFKPKPGRPMFEQMPRRIPGDGAVTIQINVLLCATLNGRPLPTRSDGSIGQMIPKDQT